MVSVPASKSCMFTGTEVVIGAPELPNRSTLPARKASLDSATMPSSEKRASAPGWAETWNVTLAPGARAPSCPC